MTGFSGLRPRPGACLCRVLICFMFFFSCLSSFLTVLSFTAILIRVGRSSEFCQDSPCLTRFYCWCCPCAFCWLCTLSQGGCVQEREGTWLPATRVKMSHLERRTRLSLKSTNRAYGGLFGRTTRAPYSCFCPRSADLLWMLSPDTSNKAVLLSTLSRYVLHYTPSRTNY